MVDNGVEPDSQRLGSRSLTNWLPHNHVGRGSTSDVQNPTLSAAPSPLSWRQHFPEDHLWSEAAQSPWI